MKKPFRFTLYILLTLLAVIICWRLLVEHRRATAAAVREGAPAAVAVVVVERGTLERSVTLTADFRAYQEIDVHAKVAGFVKSIPVDIGDRVKQGGILATLEIPELQEDLKKAQAGVDAASEAVNESSATYQGVHLDFTRLLQVTQEHPKLVAQQELDDARAKDQAAAAALANARQRVEEAQAEQKRDLALVDYSVIAAPFDGVVTRRYADVGAMIQAGGGSMSGASAIVRFAQENVVRTIFPVPESEVQAVYEGAPVSIRINGLDRTILGSVTRFSRQLDPGTRTMETEADLPNPGLGITPGMYGWATLTLEAHKNALYVPVEAIAAGENPTAYVVTAENTIEERAVKLGMETPNRVEILGGLAQGDLVFIGNRARVRLGEHVKPLRVQPSDAAYPEKKG